jgi:hypothetical protein
LQACKLKMKSLLLSQAFLRDNRLTLIIRSHEGPDARFKREQDDKMGSIDGGFSTDHETASRLLGNGGHSVVGSGYIDAPQLATSRGAAPAVGNRGSQGLLCLLQHSYVFQ